MPGVWECLSSPIPTEVAGLAKRDLRLFRGRRASDDVIEMSQLSRRYFIKFRLTGAFQRWRSKSVINDYDYNLRSQGDAGGRRQNTVGIGSDDHCFPQAIVSRPDSVSPTRRELNVDGELKVKVTRQKCTENRKCIVEMAAALFREHGFDGVGLADIMKAAGLTHGGFYRHFRSKHELAAEASSLAIAETVDHWVTLIDGSSGQPIAALAENYFSDLGLDEPKQACIFASLASEVPRHGPTLQAAFRDGLETLVRIVAHALPAATEKTRRTEALSAISAMVGALVLARSAGGGALSDEILDATRTALLRPM
jgi:TetR/AcrR family transcriptional repressor of nem operon